MIQALYKMRHWAGWVVLGLIAVGVAYWGLMYSTQTQTIRLATGAQGGWYYEFGSVLKRHIERQTPYRVVLLETDGSVDNRRRLLGNEADMAIVQVTAISMQNLAAIIPLWDDYVQIVARRDSGIQSLWDLEGRNVAIGVPGSGYRANAMRVLDYYGIESDRLGNNEAYFNTLLTDPELDAAIVTTGLVNADLRAVLASGDFDLIALPGVPGFTFNHTYYRQAEIPAGVYPAVGLSLPAEPVTTVTTDAILIGRRDLPQAMVEAILPVVDSLDLRADAPSLVQRDPSTDPIWRLLPAHDASVKYFTPYAGLGMLADFLSELAKFKELLLLFLLIIPVGIYQWKQHQRMQRENRLRGQMRQLEDYFEDVVRIEQAQREAKDIRLLRDHLNQINYLKMKAMKLSLGNALGESNLFLAFLQQAHAVTREIEWRLSMFGSTTSGRVERVGA